MGELESGGRSRYLPNDTGDNSVCKKLNHFSAAIAFTQQTPRKGWAGDTFKNLMFKYQVSSVAIAFNS